MMATTVSARESIPAYVALVSEGTRLLMPQAELRTLESALDVDMGNAPSHAIGTIGFEDTLCPVFAFTKDLRRISDMPAQRRVCVVLGTQTDCVGLLCDDVVTIQNTSLVLRPLPTCMKMPGSPVKDLAIFDDEVVVVSDAGSMRAFLES